MRIPLDYWHPMTSGTNTCILKTSRFAEFRILLVFLCLWLGASGSAMATTEPFRFGVSNLLFTVVNENDARAAMKVWAQVTARSRQIPIDPEIFSYQGVDEIARALISREIDAIGLTTFEYHQLLQHTSADNLLILELEGTFAETYLLLAHQSSAIFNLADIKNKNMTLHNHFRSFLATRWLDLQLNSEGLPSLKKLTRQITSATNLSQVVLPVFFRQVDTCIVTRRAFETMKELNPQVGAELRIIAESEPLIPGLLAFRKDYSPPFLQDLVAALESLNTTPAGQQIMMIFNSSNLRHRPAAELESTLQMIGEYLHLEPQQSAGTGQ